VEEKQAGLLTRWRLRLLDGGHRWGSIDIRPDRFGLTRYRLVVYPPGISETERRRVRLWRGWPLWGVLLWIASEICLGQVMPPWQAIAFSTAAFLGAGAVTLIRAGDARIQVRTMVVMVLAGHYDPTATDNRNRLETLAVTLVKADAQRELGLISAIDHEATWWWVYDHMPVGRTAPQSGPTKRSA
jgi:hypothetical protein